MSITEDQAISIARAWVGWRKEVRQHLIAAARRKHPGQETPGEWPTDEIRKLHQYPSDLSEARLLVLIDEE